MSTTALQIAPKCKYTLPIALLVSYLFAFSNHSLAQTLTSDFVFTTSIVCKSENISITNNATNAISYAWDFCEGDLNNIPAGIDMGTISFSSGPEDIDLVKDNLDWYGFIVSPNNNLLVRADYGNDLNNIPGYVNLGDFGGLLSKPSAVIILYENGNWYGFLTSADATSKLVRLSFGTSLANNPIAEDMGNFNNAISSCYGIEFAKDNGNNFLFISNRSSRTITRINFGNSVDNNPTATDITILQLSAGGFYRNVALTKTKSKWYGLAVFENGNIQKLEFGESLLNSPILINITANIPSTIFFPTDVKFVKDKGNNLAFILGRDGKLHQLNFKDSLSNNFPDYLNMDNIGGFTITQGFSWVKENSQWYVGSISASLNKLYQMKFPNVCSASQAESTQFEPANVNYSTSGYKYVSLTTFNDFGESDYSYDSILVNRGPTARFGSTFQCVGSNTQFTDSSYFDKPITDYFWNFGDPGSGSNNTSTLKFPLHSFTLPGDYNVSLQTTDECGEMDILMNTIKIYTANDISPDFLTSTPTCQNSGISYIDQSTFVEDEILEWNWDFNGEGSSNQKDPLFTFLTSGNKGITLTVTGLSGCSYSILKTLTIEEAPTTAFGFDNVCNSKPTTFTDLTTGSNLTTWNWDFGDGSNSTTQNPSHIYATPGKYAVTLTVGNSLGCNTSITDTVYNHAIPVVSFTNDLPCSSSPIQFTDQSMVQDANMVSWEWDFGDGTTASERNPQHLYGQTGDFTVKLRAYSQFGCVDSIESVITILQGPEVDFSWDKSCTNETTAFTDNTLTAGIPISNWNWLIDGAIIEDQNPQYNFTNTGTYTVQLSVTTNNLCSQTFSKDIIIEDPPATSFGYFESCTDDSVTFYDTTPANIATREWRIESVLVGSDSSLTSNLTPDNYLVSLVTTSSANCTGISQQNINITGVIKAAYTPSTNYGANPLTIQFNNQSSGTTDYFWDFDYAGGTSTESNPQFTYNDLGSYQVKLIAYGGQDCSDTTSQTIEVVELEHAVSIEAIIAQEDGKLNVILKNNGSATYQESNSKLLFTLDNGAEITENFEGYLYPQATKVFIPNFSLGSTGSSKILCVSLQYNEGQKSAILAKNCLNLNNQAVVTQAYPNPTRDNINLSVVLPTAGSVIITLIDRNGAVILHDSYEAAQQGLNEYTIDTTPYRAGLYIIKVEAGREIKEMKVVISH